MVSFKVTKVWDLGSTIHVIGTVENGSIGPGAVLYDCSDERVVLNVSSVALGGGTNLPEGTVTLVVDSLPCKGEDLAGHVFGKLEAAKLQG